MRILVTGAAGFIGFHVAMRCRNMGHHVVGLDNFVPYYDVQLKRSRQKSLLDAGVCIAEHGVEDQSFLKGLVQKEAISHIVHLAAQAGVRYSLEAPHSYLRSNIDGFLSVLETARAFPHIRTVWASSSSVYGANTKLPFSEEDRTDSPTNLYGATKKANEVMASSYHHLFGLPLIGLRFFTVYGPWGRPDMAYFLFANKIVRDEPIDLFGAGSLRRDFTYIDDIVDGIIASMTSEKPYAIYNLGNNKPETVADLVSNLEEALGKKALVRIAPQPAGDMVETCADIRKAANELGFSPKTSLKAGIRAFVTWYRAMAYDTLSPLVL